MAKKSTAVIKAAKLLGPVILGLVMQAYKSNPKIVEDVKDELLQLLKNRGKSSQKLLATVEILRSQVSYLDESADDPEEAAQARVWGKRLDSCEQAAKLLQAPGSRRKDRAALKARVEALRSEIFSAYIAELDEDSPESSR